MAVDTRTKEEIRIQDEELQATAQKVIQAEPDLEGAPIEVSVSDGWLTLRGAVDAFWKKRMTEDTVATLTGVRGVTNELTVVPSRTYEDQLIADSIIAALERDLRVDASTIDVRVDGGNVTLSGTVSSLAAFRSAQTTAETTPGVLAVDNDLEIR